MKKLVLFLQTEHAKLNRGLCLESRVNVAISQQSSSHELSVNTSAITDQFELLYDKTMTEVLEYLAKDIQEEKLRTMLVIPGEDVLKCQLKVPAKQFRQIQKALPYLVEDQIASDPEECFIAIGERNGELLSCSIIEKETLAQHYHFLKDTQLNAEKIVSDDTLIKPSAPCLHVFENRILMATAQGLSFAFDNSLLNIYLEKFLPIENVLLDSANQELSGEEPADQITSSDLAEGVLNKEILTIVFYKQDKQNIDELKNNVMHAIEDYKKNHGFDYDINSLDKSIGDYYLETASQLFDRHNTSHAINLLQGEYKPKRIGNIFNVDMNWKPVAWLTLIFIFIHLLSVFVETIKYENAAEEADVKAKVVFEEIFPKTKNYTRMKERVASLVKDIVTPNENQFLKLIYLFSEAMQAINSSSPESLKPSQIQYEQSSAELKVEIVALNFDTLNSLKEKAESSGLILEIASTSTEKNGVKGHLKVKIK